MPKSNFFLRIDIIEGKNLASKDTNGYSDPYVTLYIEDSTYHTQVVNKELNPRWNATFEHRINQDKPPEAIYFTCWDKDVFGKDYMGEFDILLKELWGNGIVGYNHELNKPHPYPLISKRKGEVVSGEIIVKIGIVDKSTEPLNPDELLTLWRHMSKLNIQDDVDSNKKKDTNKVDTKSQTHVRKPSVSLTDIHGWVFIEIVGAKNLPAAKNVTKTGFDMDPFVVISFSKNTFRTKVISHNLNPVWNEKFYFPVKHSEVTYKIKFTVNDWDKFSGNDLVATQTYEIAKVIPNAPFKFNGVEDLESGMKQEEIDLDVKLHLDKEYSSKLDFKINYIPYEQIKKQFWYSLAKIYDSNENNLLNYVEIETMLNSLGSSLTDETITSFFTRFNKVPAKDELTFDEIVKCLEERLRDTTISHISATSDGEEAENEHMIYLKECPICHKPNLSRLTEAEIITHVSICASNDWGNLDKFVTGDFVTESQAQRKWLSKVISKIGYGNYKIGANNANIIVQDRQTGQLVEEKMPTYIRLGIRLLYRGIKNVDSKRTKTLLENLSVKQGKKYDHPASVKDINGFIEFHNLSRDEILDPIESFKNFNEFFYRKLKPEARKLDFPNDPSILVSPADCRMMAFPTIDEAIELWIKGQQFSIQRLLGDESAAKEFEGGSLGIFRLAPQDYHRFHFPVDGRIGENKPIAGDYYTVNPMAIRSELDVYGENKRSITYIDSPKFGKVAFVAVGAMMVGSIVYTSKPFSDVKRLDEHGYFAFGGSTVVLLFQKGKTVFDDDILANSKQCLETLVRVGTHVGRNPSRH
nr:15354_t:CDS:10 [Entrophospora candida]